MATEKCPRCDGTGKAKALHDGVARLPQDEADYQRAIDSGFEHACGVCGGYGRFPARPARPSSEEGA